MEIYWPASIGEWLAWASAIITIIFGLLLLLAPAFSLKLLRLQTAPGSPEALSEARGTMAGFYLGVGLCCILFAQPLLWLALVSAHEHAPATVNLRAPIVINPASMRGIQIVPAESPYRLDHPLG